MFLSHLSNHPNLASCLCISSDTGICWLFIKNTMLSVTCAKIHNANKTTLQWLLHPRTLMALNSWERSLSRCKGNTRSLLTSTQPVNSKSLFLTTFTKDS